MHKIYLYHSKSRDPFWHVALEHCFLESVVPGEIAVLFYQNNPSVVIGRNQAVLSECHFEKMYERRIQCVRRFSGGGAVFHDSGNLNYAVIGYRQEIDVCQVFSIVMKSLADLGIKVELCSKNSIWYESQKISGSAFCYKKDKLLHHGSILFNSNLGVLTEVLDSPLNRSFTQKAVTSNRVRVMNICDTFPSVTMDQFKASFIKFFEISFCIKMDCVSDNNGFFMLKMDENYKKYRSLNWILDEDPLFSISFGEGALRFKHAKLTEMEKMDFLVHFKNILDKSQEVDIFELKNGFEKACLQFLSQEKKEVVDTFIKEVSFFEHLLKNT